MSKAQEERELKKKQKLEAERARIETMKEFEKAHADCALICGIDEAGRGPFAGPVVAGAVILDLNDPEKEILYLNDSKKLSEKKREILFKEIVSKAQAVGVGVAGAKIIDKINILKATYLAMNRAINNLTNVSFLLDSNANSSSVNHIHDQAVNDQADTSEKNNVEITYNAEIHELVKRLLKYEIDDSKSIKVIPDYILADAVHIPGISIPQEGIVKGDAKSVSIATASIIAKVTRDHIMYEYDKQYPEYGFRNHKGYGTKAHIAAIKEHGMLDIHRRSFIHF